MTHADLPKAYGPLPSQATLDWAFDMIADALAEGGVCVEVSTAGIRKPAREIYPKPALLERCLARGVPIVLSSDAHEPENVGFRFGDAVALALGVGYREVQEFKGRDRRAVPIG
jgi:histidinol-phosphatase (PHP family)